MSAKTILIAHRQGTVRDRFAAALADARHAFVTADTEGAAKEAVAKALGTGIGDIGWKQIEIVNGPRREPHLLLHGTASMLATELGLTTWSISLSHTHEHAVAVAFAAGGDHLE